MGCQFVRSSSPRASAVARYGQSPIRVECAAADCAQAFAASPRTRRLQAFGDRCKVEQEILGL